MGGEVVHRTIRLVAQATFVLSLLLAIPFSYAQVPAPEGSARLFEPRNIGLEYLTELPKNIHDERFVRLAFLAQMEQQGLLSPGTVDAIAAPEEAPPMLTYRNPQLICDMNGDGVEDVVSNDFDLPYATDWLRAMNGRDGSYAWYKYNYYFFAVNVYNRAGLPFLQPIQNLEEIPDVDGDGVCDLLTFWFTYSIRQSGAVTVIEFDVTLEMLNISSPAGMEYYYYPRTMWRQEFVSTLVVFDTGTAGTIQILNFPTGFLYAPSVRGPRWVFKTSDIHYAYVADPFGIGILCEDFYTSDHIYYGNATNGKVIWLRDQNFTVEGDVTNVTWLTGLADLGGDGELEVVMDQYYITNPRCNELNNPATNRPLFRYGRGMAMIALRGEEGDTFWETPIRDEAAARVNPETQDLFEVLIWTHAMLLPDFTGDGRADPVALYLTREFMQASSVNGRYRTHFIPVDGAAGVRIWENDVWYQGWGYPTALNANASAPATKIAVGLVDIPTLPAPGQKFPPKDMRIAVLNATDGTAAWDIQELWPQDSVLSYLLTLQQFLYSLAPYDYDGDGLKDILSAPKYIQPKGDEQELLSTAKHRYEIRSAATSDILHTFDVWGSNGMVVPCRSGDSNLTVLSGHGRRLEFTRIDPGSGAHWFQHIIYNNPTPQAATAGTEVWFLNGVCDESPSGRILFGANMGAFSFRRGVEIVPAQGVLNRSTTLDWQWPDLRGEPEFESVFDLLSIPDDELSTGEKSVINFGPAVPGLAAGAGIGLLRRRFRKGGGSA